MARLTEEQWEAVGRDYLAGLPLLRISKMHGVSRPSIHKAAKRYRWERIEPKVIDKAVAQRMSQLSDPALRSEIVEERARSRAEIITQHQIAWNKIYELREDVFLLLRGQPTKILTYISTNDDGVVIFDGQHQAHSLKERLQLAGRVMAIFEADVRALTLAQEGERRAHGFDYRCQQERNSHDEQEARRRRELIASFLGRNPPVANLDKLKLAATPMPQHVQEEAQNSAGEGSGNQREWDLQQS